MKIVSNVFALALICIVVTTLYGYRYDKMTEKRLYNDASVDDLYRQLDCLTENIYFEAAGEDVVGKIAVAQVTMQRVESPRYPNNVCRVVHQKHQFSWTADKPKALSRINYKVYDECYKVAKKVLFEGERLDSVRGALFYHTKDVNPIWNRKMQKLTVIGHHIFWRG